LNPADPLPDLAAAQAAVPDSRSDSPAESPAELPGEPLLSARGVRKAFALGDRSIEVLHGVDLELRRGESTALIGASGAGKSTLLQVLGLLERPTAGDVRLGGVDPWALSAAARSALRNREIGFVFQFYHLLPELNAVENVLLPAMIRYGRLSYRRRRRELRARAVAMLEGFGLAQRLTHRPSQLSGGERQRVAIARALFNEPSLLIADEPTGNLDTATGAGVLDLLFAEQQRRQFTLLLVSHDDRVAARCDRTLEMRDGRVATEMRDGRVATEMRDGRAAP
jgi:lipoprotein-releasing system ATP-binding protein